MMWAPANLVRLAAWFLALVDSTCRAFVWRRARRLPGEARAPDTLPAWWLGEDETAPVAIVTGAGSGIGRATAKRLHALGARVAVVCATLEEAEVTSARIAEEAEAEDRAGNVEKKKKTKPVAFGVDLRDGAAVDAFVAALDADNDIDADEVRCVIHCAGVMRCAFSKTKTSGLEETAAVNAAAPARLTELLAARLSRRLFRDEVSRSPPRLRVVTVGSFVHRAVSKREMHRWVEWVDESHDADLAHDETETKTKTKTKTRRRQDQKKKSASYVPATAYACSKTAATMLSFSYASRDAEDAGRCVVCPVLADPGLVDTAINREWPAALRFFYVRFARRLKLLASPEDAATLVCRACFLDPDEKKMANASPHPPYLFGAEGARLAPSRVVADAETRGSCVRAVERWARL
jgi:NAD(P)-dependent dehydrogenase (short-subunit alcohol dehydrogenase family)